MEPALKTYYQETVIPSLQKEFGFKNVNQVPKISKVVINCGIGKHPDRKQAVEDVVEEIRLITGRKAVPTIAKNSISNFKLREGEAIGAKVTLRGVAMYDFILRLIKMALPRVRDFRGVSFKAFDGRGNYTLGISDHTIFPEIELDKVKRNIGFDICFVTTAVDDKHAHSLLREMGMPFRKQEKKEQSIEQIEVAGADLT